MNKNHNSINDELNTRRVSIQIKKLNDDLIPEYQTEGAAGVDLKANIKSFIVLLPFERILVPTGVFLQLPDGVEAQIRPRSGLAFRSGVTVLNSPGTIDSDYRGEVQVLLINLGSSSFTIEPKARIAQMVFSSYLKVDFKIVENLEVSDRGLKGFGSTGLLK